MRKKTNVMRGVATPIEKRASVSICHLRPEDKKEVGRNHSRNRKKHV